MAQGPPKFGVIKFRIGSKGDMPPSNCDVCFTPESGLHDGKMTIKWSLCCRTPVESPAASARHLSQRTLSRRPNY
jgi:hypothetical protein